MGLTASRRPVGIYIFRKNIYISSTYGLETPLDADGTPMGLRLDASRDAHFSPFWESPWHPWGTKGATIPKLLNPQYGHGDSVAWRLSDSVTFSSVMIGLRPPRPPSARNALGGLPEVTKNPLRGFVLRGFRDHSLIRRLPFSRWPEALPTCTAPV